MCHTYFHIFALRYKLWLNIWKYVVVWFSSIASVVRLPPVVLTCNSCACHVTIDSLLLVETIYINDIRCLLRYSLRYIMYVTRFVNLYFFTVTEIFILGGSHKKIYWDVFWILSFHGMFFARYSRPNWYVIHQECNVAKV